MEENIWAQFVWILSTYIVGVKVAEKEKNATKALSRPMGPGGKLNEWSDTQYKGAKEMNMGRRQINGQKCLLVVMNVMKQGSEDIRAK